jgi:hypothetical protein
MNIEDFRATSKHFDASDFEALTHMTVEGLVGSKAAPRAVPHLYAFTRNNETWAVAIIEIDGRFEWGWHMGGTDHSPTLAEAEAGLFAELTWNDGMNAAEEIAG